MFRGRLAIVGCVLLAAVAAQAGEIKVHNWPVQYRYVPQEVTTIGVVMDVGFWIEIINQDDVIKLEQVSIQKYEGCLDLQVKCNFNLTFTCEIVPTGTIPGTYSCAFLNSRRTGRSHHALCEARGRQHRQRARRQRGRPRCFHCRQRRTAVTVAAFAGPGPLLRRHGLAARNVDHRCIKGALAPHHDRARGSTRGSPDSTWALPRGERSFTRRTDRRGPSF